MGRLLCELPAGDQRQSGEGEARLREAVLKTERTLAAHAIALKPESRADAVVAVYELLDRERAPATAARVTKLIEALAGGREPEGRGREHETGGRPAPGVRWSPGMTGIASQTNSCLSGTNSGGDVPRRNPPRRLASRTNGAGPRR